MTAEHGHMDAHEYLPRVGRATGCIVAVHHFPKPLRFVWHHILPQVCGGLSVPANCAAVCDSCHYSVHILLYSLAQGATIKPGSRVQVALARHGYAAAVAAGTVSLIPKESDVVLS